MQDLLSFVLTRLLRFHQHSNVASVQNSEVENVLLSIRPQVFGYKYLKILQLHYFKRLNKLADVSIE